MLPDSDGVRRSIVEAESITSDRHLERHQSLGKDDQMGYLDASVPLAVAATEAIHRGDVSELERLLATYPKLATLRLGNEGGISRTLLHVVTDWPGHYPDGARMVAVLVAAGADVGARFEGPHTETPLHWAASSDDVAVLDALLDAGADIEAAGAVIGGGTALADACAFAQWKAARRLVERGALTSLWQEASLGLLDRIHRRFAHTPPPDANEITEGLWAAAHGGQIETARFFLDHGADPAWIGYDGLTPLGAALRSGAADIAALLRSRGVTDSGQGPDAPPACAD
ncbi:ankyrin repeat domain-containing protein [Actinomadura nitritigenes]|uniref:ankyrin repeat domain-containing protein n=1 Tax=Actinomadura nitritigenes TaxID=134602 RepID=UPI003D8EF6E1